MKTPRVQDFDPNAKIPQLGTPLDNLPAIQKHNPSPTQSMTKEQLTDQKQPSVSPPVRTGVRASVRRQLTRYAFEFYQDQVEELRQISLKEKMQGGKGSMSEMVREAIDEYLVKKKRTGE
jgi:hypothetical protein